MTKEKIEQMTLREYEEYGLGRVKMMAMMKNQSKAWLRQKILLSNKWFCKQRNTI